MSRALHFGNIGKTWGSELQKYDKNVRSCIKNSGWQDLRSVWSLKSANRLSKIGDVLPESALAVDHLLSVTPSWELEMTAAP